MKKTVDHESNNNVLFVYGYLNQLNWMEIISQLAN